MRVRVCQCGHLECDHKSNRSPTALKFGICLTTDCGCQDFSAEDPRTGVRP
jgi:hypothetical protein